MPGEAGVDIHRVILGVEMQGDFEIRHSLMHLTAKRGNERRGRHAGGIAEAILRQIPVDAGNLTTSSMATLPSKGSQGGGDGALDGNVTAFAIRQTS